MLLAVSATSTYLFANVLLPKTGSVSRHATLTCCFSHLTCLQDSVLPEGESGTSSIQFTQPNQFCTSSGSGRSSTERRTETDSLSDILDMLRTPVGLVRMNDLHIDARFDNVSINVEATISVCCLPHSQYGAVGCVYDSSCCMHIFCSPNDDHTGLPGTHFPPLVRSVAPHSFAPSSFSLLSPSAFVIAAV